MRITLYKNELKEALDSWIHDHTDLPSQNYRLKDIDFDTDENDEDVIDIFLEKEVNDEA